MASNHLILPLTLERDYASSIGAAQRVLFEAEEVELGPPLVFPPPEEGYYKPIPPSYAFPAVTVTALRDVVVRGRSTILSAPDAIVRHGLYDLPTQITPEEFYARLRMSKSFDVAGWLPTSPFDVAYLPEAAAFTDGTSFNYAHWLSEVLPRIAAFSADPAMAGVPLIVDTDLHPNMLRSIKLLVGDQAEIHQLAPTEALRVGVLHNISPTSYGSFKSRVRTDEGITHGLFGGHALRAMVDQLRQAVAPLVDKTPSQKVFIRRRSNIRHVANEFEIEEALLGRGFTAVQPDAMGFDEQVAVFSNAQVVVGATGAAITNLLFCRPDCPVVVMVPRFKYTAYWYWRNMASTVGVKVLHVTGERLAPPDEDPFHPTAVHEDFRVDLKDVLEAVTAAGF